MVYNEYHLVRAHYYVFMNGIHFPYIAIHDAPTYEYIASVEVDGHINIHVDHSVNLNKQLCDYLKLYMTNGIYKSIELCMYLEAYVMESDRG